MTVLEQYRAIILESASLDKGTVKLSSINKSVVSYHFKVSINGMNVPLFVYQNGSSWEILTEIGQKIVGSSRTKEAAPKESQLMLKRFSKDRLKAVSSK